MCSGLVSGDALRGGGGFGAAGDAVGPDLADRFIGVSAEGFDEGPVGVHVHDPPVHGDGDDPVGEVPTHRERLAGNSDDMPPSVT